MSVKKVITVFALVLMITASVQAMVIPGRWEKVAAEKPGSKIVLTLMTGDHIECSFVRLLTDSLIVSTLDGVKREYSKANIERITSAKKRQDSLVNGAVIGAVVGGMSSTILVGALAQAGGLSKNIYWGIPVAFGIGAGIGMAADATSKHYIILYEAPENVPKS